MRPTIFVLATSGLYGGVRVIFEMASRLAQRGHPAEVWAPVPPSDWFTPRPLPYRQFPDAAAMIERLGQVRANKVATWWQTAYWVWPALGDDDRGFELIQDDERNYALGVAQEREVLHVYRLGLTPITIAQWVTDHLRSQLGLSPVYVGCGVDHDAFAPLPLARARHRVLAPWRPQVGPRDLKGSETLLATMRALRRRSPEASLVTFGTTEGPDLSSEEFPHEHLQSVPDGTLREAYCRAGAFLLPSRHEGLGLTVLEAMACECPVVVTDAHGNREFSRHGETCLVGHGPDELAGCLRRIQTDPALADALGRRGRQESLKYQWDPVIARLEAVFR